MFKIALGSSTLFAIANALAMQTGAQSLAQTASTQGACCCHAKPCMPSCPEPCGPHVPTPPLPEINIHAPEPVRDVVFNMDMILTRIMHDQHPKPEVEPVPLPEPKSQDEVNFIHDVVSPIVIQMVNNDIIPAIPTCELPEGTDPDYWGLTRNPENGKLIPKDYEQYIGAVQKGEQYMPDAEAVMEEVLLDSLKGMELAPGTDVDSLVDRVMKEQAKNGKLANLNLTTEDGQNELNFLIKGMESVVEEHFTTESTGPAVVEEVVDEVTKDLKGQGFDGGAFDLKDIAKAVIDGSQ